MSAPARSETLEREATLCHCLAVSYGRVLDVVDRGAARSLSDVQRTTGACTRCFGCRFELERLLRDRLGADYVETSFVAAPDGGRSLVARLRQRIHPRASVLPRRMYMPVLHGFQGRDVVTRAVVFNGGDDDGTRAAVRMRADLLTLDGTRVGVVESVVGQQQTAVISSESLPAAPALPDGVGVWKVVVQADQLGTLRPYFQIVSPGGITSTHEKAGGRDPREFGPRPYHWVLPLGYSSLEQEAYFFCTNTQTEPMRGQSLVWHGEDGTQVEVALPPLELDQSACVALHEHVPAILSGRVAGSVRLVPAAHKVAGFMLRYERANDRWRVQHL